MIFRVPDNQQDMYLPEIIEEDTECSNTLPKGRRGSLFSKILGKPGVEESDDTKEPISAYGGWRSVHNFKK